MAGHQDPNAPAATVARSLDAHEPLRDGRDNGDLGHVVTTPIFPEKFDDFLGLRSRRSEVRIFVARPVKSSACETLEDPRGSFVAAANGLLGAVAGGRDEEAWEIAKSLAKGVVEDSRYALAQADLTPSAYTEGIQLW